MSISRDEAEELRDELRKLRQKDGSELPHVLYEARVAIVAALKQEGYSRNEIADALNMTPAGVDWSMRKARERGLIAKGLAAAVEELDNEALPLAVESLIHHLREKNPDVTLKTLQGRGAFLTKGSGVSGNGGGNVNFQLNFVLPEGMQAQATTELSGKILGTPKP